MLKSSRLTEGIPYWRERTAVIVSSDYEPQLDEVIAQPPAVLPLIIEGLTKMLRADQILADENFAEFC
jgi:hypothetical protein